MGRIVPRSWDFQREVAFQPALSELRVAEALDDVVAGAADEWERMVRLARWAYDQWRPSAPNPYPPWDARVVLREIRAGRTGGFCAQYAVVLVQSLLSFGHQARYLAVDTEPSHKGHLGVEVWSNQFDKWAVLDPFFGAWVEDGDRPGVPLSALEIHCALSEGRRQDLSLRSIGGDEARHPPPRAAFLPYFAHLAIDLRNDHLSRPLHAWNRPETYLSWTDPATNGRPHIFTRFASQELDFDFPLNQVQVSLQRGSRAGELLCGLRTNMTDAVAIRVTVDGGPSTRIDVGAALRRTTGETTASFFPNPAFGLLLTWTWPLRPGRNEASFQAVGPGGVEGPAARVEVVWEKDGS